MDGVTNSLKELKKEEAKKPGVLTPLSSVSAHKRVDTKSFYSIYTQRITEMEKENKELRAKCVDNAALAKEAADLRVEVEAKEKELAATVEELRVLKEKEAKQDAVLDLAEKELREQLQRLQDMKQKAEQGQTRIAEMEVRSFHALKSSRGWWRCTLPSSATRGSSGR